MKFEIPRIDINVFSEDVVMAASGIENSATVGAAKNTLEQEGIETSNILTFTFD